MVRDSPVSISGNAKSFTTIATKIINKITAILNTTTVESLTVRN
jgi:hypothetical protein